MSFVKIFSLMTILIIDINDFAVSQLNYTCSLDNATFGFSPVDPLSISHSALDLLSECSVLQCTTNRYDGGCRSSATPCFRYRDANNFIYCAPASLCSLLQPCDSITGTCSSNTSVCIINSCCRSRSVCLPLSWTTFCPSADSCQPTFASREIYAMNANSSAISTGDFNNDQWPDLVVSHYGTNTTSLFLGTGNGTLMYQSTFQTGSDPLNISVADFDNDTHLDLAILNAADATISVLFGYGNGSFTPRIALATGTNPVSIATGDFNNDGLSDLIVGNGLNHTIGVYLSFGNRSFSTPIVYFIDGIPMMLAIADFNNDFNLDLVISVNVDLEYWKLFTSFGRGDGSFDDGTTLLTTSNVVAVAIGNFNGDFQLDIVTVHSLNYLVIFIGDGNGNFTIETTINVYSDACHLAVADFNADFRLDIAIASNVSKDVRIFLGFDSGGFAEPLIFPVDDSLCRVALADFNNDGLIDLAVINTRNSSVDVILNSCSCCRTQKV